MLLDSHDGIIRLPMFMTSVLTFSSNWRSIQYERMKKGAYDMCLPMPSKDIFMKALQLAVQKNVHYLPPPGDGVKLYLRPMLMGTGQQLGLYPSPQMSFLVYVSPTGNYFSAATAYVS